MPAIAARRHCKYRWMSAQTLQKRVFCARASQTVSGKAWVMNINYVIQCFLKKADVGILACKPRWELYHLRIHWALIEWNLMMCVNKSYMYKSIIIYKQGWSEVVLDASMFVSNCGWITVILIFNTKAGLWASLTSLMHCQGLFCYNDWKVSLCDYIRSSPWL